jgi:hypothetical protein
MNLTKRLNQWLSGTTCHQHVYGTRKEERHIHGSYWLLKHPGHSEYIDRFTGTKRCGTYHILIDLGDDPVVGRKWLRTLSYNSQGLKRWNGRWTKAHEKELLAFIVDLTIKETAI